MPAGLEENLGGGGERLRAESDSCPGDVGVPLQEAPDQGAVPLQVLLQVLLPRLIALEDHVEEVGGVGEGVQSPVQGGVRGEARLAGQAGQLVPPGAVGAPQLPGVARVEERGHVLGHLLGEPLRQDGALRRAAPRGRRRLPALDVVVNRLPPAQRPLPAAHRLPLAGGGPEPPLGEEQEQKEPEQSHVPRSRRHGEVAEDGLRAGGRGAGARTRRGGRAAAGRKTAPGPRVTCGGGAARAFPSAGSRAAPPPARSGSQPLRRRQRAAASPPAPPPAAATALTELLPSAARRGGGARARRSGGSPRGAPPPPPPALRRSASFGRRCRREGGREGWRGARGAGLPLAAGISGAGRAGLLPGRPPPPALGFPSEKPPPPAAVGSCSPGDPSPPSTPFPAGPYRCTPGSCRPVWPPRLSVSRQPFTGQEGRRRAAAEGGGAAAAERRRGTSLHLPPAQLGAEAEVPHRQAAPLCPRPKGGGGGREPAGGGGVPLHRPRRARAGAGLARGERQRHPLAGRGAAAPRCARRGGDPPGSAGQRPLRAEGRRGNTGC